jgi:outer membrane immunogenic protein
MTMRSLLSLLLLSIASVNLMAQTQPSNEIALDYTYVHTNAPPAGCGCFSMNGGSGSYAYHFGPQFAAVIEVGAVHAGNVDGTGLDLTLTSYLGGPRFYYRRPHARFVPTVRCCWVRCAQLEDWLRRTQAEPLRQRSLARLWAEALSST